MTHATAARVREFLLAVGFEPLDAAAQAEGLDPLDVLGPALTGLRESMRIGIVRSAG